MMTIDSTSLADMTISLLERTAMVLAEEAVPGDESPEPTRFACISYSGPSKGTVTLGATDGFLRDVAASLLGVEPTDVNVETDGYDVLMEMANTVAGCVIFALSGDRGEHLLGLPERLAAADVPVDVQSECTVLADSGALRVLWSDAGAARPA